MRLIIEGKPPSVNHMYHRRKGKAGNTQLILTREAEAWYEVVQWVAQNWARNNMWKMPEPKQKIIMRVWYYFKNDNRIDVHNSHKLLADALQGIIYPNDKWLLIQDQNYYFDKQNPRIELEFEVVKGV